MTTIHSPRYTKMYKDTKIYRFYAHPKDPTTMYIQRYTKIYKDIQILCTPKGYDYYTHTKI